MYISNGVNEKMDNLSFHVRHSPDSEEPKMDA